MDVRDAAAEYRIAPLTELAADDVPPGYKRTEVGVIPAGWKVVALGALAHGVFRGASPRPIDDPVWFDDKSAIGWVRISDVTASGRYLTGTTQRLSKKGVQSSRYLPSGALIMSICATVGRPIETRIDVCIHDGFVVFDRPNVDQGFLYHVLADLEPRWSAKGQTGSQMNLNTGLIKTTSVPVPPTKAEQQAIAEALSDADALIESLQQLIAKHRAIKQGAMQALLTGRQRLPGFPGARASSPPDCGQDGRAPAASSCFGGEWQTKRLGDIGTFRKGQGIPRSAANTGKLPAVRYGEIYTTHSDYVRSFATWISEAAAASATRVGRGDILFAGSGETKEEIGKCVAIVEDVIAYAGGDVVIFHPQEGEPLYFGYALNVPEVNEQKARRGQGDAVVHISSGALAQVVLSLPTVAEQSAIAAALSDMDAAIDALETRLAKTRALKAGMMQQLLTGRIRLPLDRAV